MKLLLRPMLLALALLTAQAHATLVSGLSGATAAQAPMGWEAFSRFSTDAVDDGLLAALAGGSSGALYAASGNVGIQYLGTSAARGATLSFGGAELFQTRSGCDYATALVDDFCIVDSIGMSRSISGLAAGDALHFDLLAFAQLIGDPAEQRASDANFDSFTAARLLDLGGGSFVLGFEEGRDGDFNDMLFLVSGATTQAPAAANGLPEPGSLALVAGALALALRRRRI